MAPCALLPSAMRRQSLARLGPANRDDAHRRLVEGGSAVLDQVIDGPHLLVHDWIVAECVRRMGCAEEGILGSRMLPNREKLGSRGGSTAEVRPRGLKRRIGPTFLAAAGARNGIRGTEARQMDEGPGRLRSMASQVVGGGPPDHAAGVDGGGQAEPAPPRSIC